MLDMVTILGELKNECFTEFEELLNEVAVTFAHFDKEVVDVVDVDDDKIEIYCTTDLKDIYEKYILEVPYNIEKDYYHISRVFCIQIKK